jgi:hypothetical protein
MLRGNIDEVNQNMDISNGGQYYASFAAGEKTWDQWEKMEIIRGKRLPVEARQGGADSNLIYDGPPLTEELDALLKKAGIGI